MSRPFTARYGGKCPGCGESIEVGDILVWVDDEAAHQTCEYEVTKPAERPTCNRCWLEIAPSGVCGCDE